MSALLKWLAGNRFILGIAIAIGLAWIVPEWGAKGGLLRSEYTTKAGIFTIFLLQGLVLPTRELLNGMRQWKIHALIQGAIFLVFPLVTAIILLPWLAYLPSDLLIGFAFMALLPSTVATAVIYSVKAGGNFSITLCNTTLSNLAGILLLPILFTWVVIQAGGDTSGSQLFAEICGLLLLPLALGQGIRLRSRRICEWIAKHKSWVSITNSNIILYIIFCVFSQSVADRIWSEQSLATLVGVAALTLAVLIGIRLLLWAGLARSTLARDRRIAAFFCGSQKTFGVGVPLAQSIFAYGDFNIVLILLPLMIYHPLQIVIDGILANMCARRIPASTGK